MAREAPEGMARATRHRTGGRERLRPRGCVLATGLRGHRWANRRRPADRGLGGQDVVSDDRARWTRGAGRRGGGAPGGCSSCAPCRLLGPGPDHFESALAVACWRRPGPHPEHPAAVEGCCPASRGLTLELLTCRRHYEARRRPVNRRIGHFHSGEAPSTRDVRARVPLPLNRFRRRRAIATLTNSYAISRKSVLALLAS